MKEIPINITKEINVEINLTIHISQNIVKTSHE